MGKNIWLKLETQQPTGSFKVRPAFNGILKHLEAARTLGVLTSSSGNFAQALAYASDALGVSAQIVMTSNASSYKMERTRAWGAELVLSGPSFEERWETTHRLARETGRVLLHPYDSEETITGDGTLALELMEQLRGDFTVLVPSSGGGLLAGIASALRFARPECEAYGVQPEVNGSLKQSWDAGKRVKVKPFTTVADALVAATPGELTFDLIQRYARGVMTVSEEALCDAVAWLREEQKLVVEAGGAAGVAALLSGQVSTAMHNVVVVLSGGNGSAFSG